ncbi:shikimate dehydrogenase [Agrobacterium sp. 13-626]|nr:shikimate dehydrogenase [Agrobacterium sp. 13-626]
MSAVPSITGNTRFVPLIGHPVRQVKSPVPMNEWFAAHHVDAVMVPVDIEPERVRAFIESLRGAGNCAGLSVTMPHKLVAFSAVDELTPRARKAGAVNTIRRNGDGSLSGDMLDGVAMVRALEQNGTAVSGKTVLVVGAGGAGSAINHALAEAGAAAIVVIERDPAKSLAVADRIRTDHPAIAVFDHLPDDLKVDIAINASPTGMSVTDPHPFPLDSLPDLQMVAEAVTKPEVTDWLRAAEARGIRIQPGAQMTLAQLEAQISFWGLNPDKEV